MIYTTEKIVKRMRAIKRKTGLIRRCYDLPAAPGPADEAMRAELRRKARALDNEAAFLVAMSGATGGDNGE